MQNVNSKGVSASVPDSKIPKGYHEGVLLSFYFAVSYLLLFVGSLSLYCKVYHCFCGGGRCCQMEQI